MGLDRTPLTSLEDIDENTGGHKWTTSQRIRASRTMHAKHAVLSRIHKRPAVIRTGALTHRKHAAMGVVQTRSGSVEKKSKAVITNRLASRIQKRVKTGAFSRWKKGKVKANAMDYMTRVEIYEALVTNLQERRAQS